MPFYERGDTRIYYEEAGQGFPVLVLPGGGLNATIANLGHAGSFDPLKEFSGDFRLIASDLRNANAGQSTGPLEIDRPWDGFADDQLGLMDHLGIDRFLVVGFCIGGPFIWNLIRQAPERVVAAVLGHPSGFNPDAPTVFHDNNLANWAPKFLESRPDLAMADVEAFLTSMYQGRGDFLFTVDRDFVRSCHTPVLIMPDDIPPHPYAAAMESAELAPNAQVSTFPWRTDPTRLRMAVRHAGSFLKAHVPAAAAVTAAAAE